MKRPRTAEGRWLFHVIICVLTAGCGLMKPSSEGSIGVDLTCSPAAVLPASILKQESEAPQEVAKAALGIASILRMTPLLDRVREFEHAVATEQGQSVLNLIQANRQVLAESMLVSLEIEAVTAEVHCNLTRVHTLLDALEKHQSTRSNTATVASVIIAGLTSALTGWFTLASNTLADGIAAIVGGALTAGFGTAAVVSHSSHRLHHERNLLSEVWEDRETPALFPQQVWRLLKEERRDGRTLREELRGNWREQLEELNKKQGKDQTDLFFGKGGEYGIEDLRTRLTMLEGLAAMLQLMQQDVKVMIEYLAKGQE